MTHGGWKAPSNIPGQAISAVAFFSAQWYVGIHVGIQSSGGQLHVQAIQHHRSHQSLTGPGQVGQQQAHRGRRHLGVNAGQPIKPWTLQPLTNGRMAS